MSQPVRQPLKDSFGSWRRLLSSRWARAALHTLIIMALAGGFAAFAAANLPHHANDHDATHYLCMAHNLVHHGTISTGRSLTPQPWIDAWRSPGYPALLAAGIVLVPGLQEIPLPRFLRDDLLPLKKWQIGWLLLVAVVAGVFAWRLTGSPWPGYVAGAIIAYSPALMFFLNRFYSEFGAAVVLFFFSLSFYWCLKRPRWWLFLLAGLLLGGGALTRAVLMYFWPLAVLLVACAAWRKALPWPKAIAGLLLFTLAFALPVGAWMARNNHYFGRWILTFRGGHVLDIRANHAMMTGREHLAALVYYTPWTCINPLAHESPAPADFYDPPHYQKCLGLDLYALTLGRVLDMKDFNRLRVQNRGDTFEMTGQHNWARHTKWLGHYTVGDLHSQKRAINKILENPGGHLLASLPLAWRGLFCDTWWIALLGFAALFFLTGSSLRRGNWPLFAFVFPSVYVYAFHSLVSVNAHRFNSPLMPVLAVCLAICLHRIWGYLARRRAAKAEATHA
ncbi:MAG: hypothetical protein K9K66_16260 [Desulfarculaceae bacterium]|nr:hypothetical protein [Desulfarculaceae bacterium]MCF8073354.1 hypothetical protein [Desulfarculaceae bacterium]MCF8103210.1 hypothetical protein [Desulfarculaceae bacterium]MCF8118219.1 hypothetical protein [Desulfarculaceae bacterium]